jgi:hypothetical protein
MTNALVYNCTDLNTSEKGFIEQALECFQFRKIFLQVIPEAYFYSGALLR